MNTLEESLAVAAEVQSYCHYCGLSIIGRDRICSLHVSPGSDWPVANRLMCNGLHRGNWPEPDPNVHIWL